MWRSEIGATSCDTSQHNCNDIGGSTWTRYVRFEDVVGNPVRVARYSDTDP